MSLAAFFKFIYVLYCIFVWRCIHKLNCFIYIVSQIVSIYMKGGGGVVFVFALCSLCCVRVMLLLYSCICLVHMHFIMVFYVCVCVYELYLMCVCACPVFLVVFFLCNKLELWWLYLAHTIKNNNHSKEQRKMIDKMYSM